MKKRELIKKYNGKLNVRLNLQMIQIYKEFIHDLQQLDEPRKVVVPQFVADYIEWTKEEDYHLLGAMDTIMTSRRKNLYEWFYDDDNIELFAHAWLDGYEVEEEKRYFLKFKGVNSCSRYLKQNTSSGDWYMGTYGVSENIKVYHTRKELEEAGFGWVFDCPGIEIEKVE